VPPAGRKIALDTIYTQIKIFVSYYIIFFWFPASRPTPASQEAANSGSSGYVRTWRCLISSDFSYTYPSPPPFARFVPLPGASRAVGWLRRMARLAVDPHGRILVETTAPESSPSGRTGGFPCRTRWQTALSCRGSGPFESDKSSESHFCRTMSHPTQSRPGHNRLVILPTIG
jgi:hypothetical protein